METLTNASKSIIDSGFPVLKEHQTFLLAGVFFISCFQLIPAVRYFIRVLLMFFCITSAAVLCIPVSLTCNLFGYPGHSHHYCGRLIAYLTQLLLNQRYYILDDEAFKLLKGKPAIYICNHQSSLDLAYQGLIFPKNCTAMAKKSLQYVPFFGLYLRLSGIVLIDRKNHGKAMATTSVLAKTMKEKNIGVLIYPEGTRSGFEEPNLLPFKKGAFHLSIETGYPIVPIVFSNSSHLFSTKRWRCESGAMGIKVLPPISPEGRSKENIQEFVDEVHSTMKTCLEEISAIDYSKL